jgi:hypothetical protein
MHEERENGKSYLPGPCFLLHFVDRFRPQPLPRISFRRVVPFEEVPGLVGPPPRWPCDRFREHGCFRMGGTPSPDPPQFWLDEFWYSWVCAHPAIEGINGTV